MRVVVDLDLCQGHAVCQGEAPEIFRVSTAGPVCARRGDPRAAARGAARSAEAAARYCPNRVITIVEGLRLVAHGASTWLSANPDKAWGREALPHVHPVFVIYNAVIQQMGWLDAGTFWHVVQNAGMWLPYCVLLPRGCAASSACRGRAATGSS
jgi:ferredoxin